MYGEGDQPGFLPAADCVVASLAGLELGLSIISLFSELGKSTQFRGSAIDKKARGGEIYRLFAAGGGSGRSMFG